MHYIIYTTSKSPWYQEQANTVADRLSMSKGRGTVKITVEHIFKPNKPITLVDSDGDRRFSWDWFQTFFLREHYDGVGFHFTPYYKKKWNLAKGINGSKNSRNKEYPEFWLCCMKEDAKGYENLTNFERLLFHEISHFDEDLDDGNGNKLTQASVHLMDYKMKAIDQYPLLVDYRAYNFKKKVNRTINQVLNLIQNAISRT